MQGLGKAPITASEVRTSTMPVTGGASGSAEGGGNILSNQKDLQEAQTAPKFGDIWNNIQAKYGAKPEKQREIKKTLGKDDFLRIMITQMKNQDPTSPFKPEQMAAEMAQFTSVEQLQNVNQNLAKLQQNHNPMERLAMTNLIGKVVTVDKERFPHTEGQNEVLAYALPKDAKSVKISIVSAETGETVLTKDLGPQKAGQDSFTWNGKKENTIPAKTGTYLMKVDAFDQQDQAIQTTSQAQARVVGISFEGSEPVFLVGDAQSQAKVTMKNIIRIDDAGGAPAASNSSAGAGGLAPVTPPPSKPNFIAFQKGVGSANLDLSQAQPDAQQAFAKYQQQIEQPAKQPPAPAQAPAPKPAQISEGFANGISQREHEDELMTPEQQKMSQVSAKR